MLKLAEYTQDKNEFLLVRVEEKGKTEHNNTVVCVLSEYEPRNNRNYAKLLLIQQQHQQQQLISTTSTSSPPTATKTSTTTNTDKDLIKEMPSQQLSSSSSSSSSSTLKPSQEMTKIVTYDDLKNTFDIFLQVLLSQHLNSEFLIRIKQIQDEYFKPSIDFIETLLNEKFNSCQNYLNDFVLYLNNSLAQCHHISFKLNANLFEKSLIVRPHLLITSSSSLIKCQSLLYVNYQDNLNESLDKLLTSSCMINFTGKSYNYDTLLESDTSINGNEEFFVCSKMLNIIRLMHTIRHYKINSYHMCCKKVWGGGEVNF